MQLVSLNVVTSELTYVTHTEEDVRSFEVSRTGGLLYTARVKHSREASQQLLRKGFTVPGDAQLIDLINGDVDGHNGSLDRGNDLQWFWAAKPGDAQRLLSEKIDRLRPVMPSAFSPDGRLAIIEHFPEQVPESWSNYTERLFASHVTSYRVNPQALLSRAIKQLFVVDTASATMRPLWTAPQALINTHVAWSPNGSSVLVGPTFLPIEQTDAAGLASITVAEVDVKSGHYRQLKIPDATAHQPLYSLRWIEPDRVEIVYPTSTLQFTRTSGEWKLVPAAAGTPAVADETPRLPEPSPVRMEFRQDANTPPVLYAMDKSGTERAVLDLNPRLKEFSLGRVEFIDWKDKQGRAWRGRLYHPVQEPENGKRVPLSAAITVENIDGGYLQAALVGWDPMMTKNMNGAEPFGEGLKVWRDRSPAFAIDKLDTPLRMQVGSAWGTGNLLSAWEIYSRAHYLHKPVELYVVPNIDRGTHDLQNPEQCYASQQGAVDWFVKYLHP